MPKSRQNREGEYHAPPIEADNTALYVRRSTYRQENEHQMNALSDWLAKHELEISDIVEHDHLYSETGSGASNDRDELHRLLGDIENDEISHVAVWELSRIARAGAIAHQYFDTCEDHGATTHITDGHVREIRPNGDGRFVAEIFMSLYAEERRTLIRRIKYGQERAYRQDKWVGKPPLGFTTDDDGYLVPNLGFNEERDGFFTIKNAIEDLAARRESFNSVSKRLKCSRNGITRVFQDDDARARYLDYDADDDRIEEALDWVRDIDGDSDHEVRMVAEAIIERTGDDEDEDDEGGDSGGME